MVTSLQLKVLYESAGADLLAFFTPGRVKEDYFQRYLQKEETDVAYYDEKLKQLQPVSVSMDDEINIYTIRLLRREQSDVCLFVRLAVGDWDHESIFPGKCSIELIYDLDLNITDVKYHRSLMD